MVWATSSSLRCTWSRSRAQRKNQIVTPTLRMGSESMSIEGSGPSKVVFLLANRPGRVWGGNY